MSVEEIKVHNLSKKKPVKKAPKPPTRGRMMDFAPRRRSPQARPQRPPQTVVVTEVEEIVEVVPEPPKPVVKPTPIPKPKPILEPEPPRPPVPPARPAAPLGAHVGLMSEARPIPKPKPILEPEPPRPPMERDFVGVAPIVPPDYYGEDEYDDELELTPEAVEEVAPVGYRPIPPSQDPTSPFLSSVNVEKRPLSSHPIAEPVEYPKYTKNVYEDDEPMLEEHHIHHQSKEHKTKIVQTKNKKSKAPMILLIVATALLGVALGVLVYFAIFKQ